MEDPDTNEMFFGADDSNFNGPWDVLLGKDVRIDPKVDLSKRRDCSQLPAEHHSYRATA